MHDSPNMIDLNGTSAAATRSVLSSAIRSASAALVDDQEEDGQSTSLNICKFVLISDQQSRKQTEVGAGKIYLLYATSYTVRWD